MAFTLRVSPAYMTPQQRMISAFRCTSSNPPEITFTNVPKGTVSFAIVLYDVDASFTHWIVWNYGTPAATNGINSYGKTQYAAPCPPAGSREHEYVFTAYALSAVPPELTPGVDLKTFTQAVQPVTLAVTRATMFYGDIPR